ncbi:iron complex transport system permease protein [Scopulibacillus darangshiensis]|uniref:Iron complex transport system permease protein n=1 Tax=Scopulibacillus darangshiensis TaxID=442528 RepID=A0A4R2PBJ8_9BACL|nr:iron ABC transporter permease [Scopulibacillus darangshiensis]TCP31684.1 iron complex transport system permease protein [Scopulibacillus darangshiensis]
MQKKSIRTRLNRLSRYTISILLALLIIVLATAIGSVPLPFLSVINSIAHHLFGASILDVNRTNDNIIWLIRLPRVLLAFLVGASLSAAGCALQGLLRNPLADPYTLGVSSGASVGAVFVIYTGFTLPFAGVYTLPIISILAGGATLIVILGLTRMINRGMTVEIVILAGIITSSFLASLVSLMVALSDKNLKNIVSWLLGSVAMKGWSYLWILIPFAAIGFILLLMNRSELNLLSVGEENAHYLGLSIKQRKAVILIAATCLTGAAVAVSGTIGFVGLVIPHMLRLIWGPNYRDLLALSFINGGTFLTAADLVSRTIIAPTELPVGVITSIIGAPVFAVILVYQRRKGGV